ncbi:MAG: hypothetical protein LBV43_12150 [Prevotella sp.]|jgi:hypothetical protein|nr:hypothetical protein [Prevotella sp.]
MKLIYILLPFLLLCSCSEDDDPVIIEEEDHSVKIEAYYTLKNDNRLYNDVDSDVFIYYGIYSSHLLEYDTFEDGVWSNEEGELRPDLHFKIDSEGKCEFISKRYDEIIMILLVSKYYNMMAHTGFSSSKPGTSAKFIFNN